MADGVRPCGASLKEGMAVLYDSLNLWLTMLQNACIARSLDPNDSRRRFTLEAQRFRRVKKHVDHEICVYGGLDIPVPPEEAGQCPCLYGV